MNPEEIQALKELIEFLQEKKIGEFRLERGELKMELKFEAAFAASAAPPPSQMDPVLLARLMSAAAPVPVASPGAELVPAAALGVSALAEPAEETLHTIKSPIVGTFYESPSPGSPAFVKAGEVVKRLVQTGQPVEYGQPLFAVRAR